MNARTTHAGWSLLDVLLALFLSAALVSVFVAWARIGTERMLARNLAAELDAQLRALVVYARLLRLHGGRLPGARFVVVSHRRLVASGALASSLATTDLLGQRYRDFLAAPEPGVLDAVVLTDGGEDGARARRLTALAVLEGGTRLGEIPPRSGGACAARGAGGAWCLPGGTGLPHPGPGHLVAFRALAPERRLDLALDRYAVGDGREWNTMHTRLGLGGHRIVGARSYDLLDGSSLGSRRGGDLRLGRRHTSLSRPYVRWAYTGPGGASSLRLAAFAPDTLRLSARTRAARLEVAGTVATRDDVTAGGGLFALSRSVEHLAVYALCPPGPGCANGRMTVSVSAPACLAGERPAIYVVPEAIASDPAQPLEGDSAFVTPHPGGWNVGLAALLEDGRRARWVPASGDVLVATRCRRSSPLLPEFRP
jgi:hypothetical protein